MRNRKSTNRNYSTSIILCYANCNYFSDALIKTFTVHAVDPVISKALTFVFIVTIILLQANFIFLHYQLVLLRASQCYYNLQRIIVLWINQRPEILK